MTYWCEILLLASVWFSCITAHPAPADQLAPSRVATNGEVNVDYALTGFKDCKKPGFDEQKIRDGFKEMIEMIGRNPSKPVPIDEYPPIDWKSAAAMDFWGPAEKSLAWRDHIKRK